MGEKSVRFEDYEHYRERGLHEVPGFAYNTYLCTIPQDFDHVPTHWHDQMEIVYVKRGSGTVAINFARKPVHAGSIVPILPGEMHSIEGDPGSRMEYENIIFSLGILDSQEPDDWCRSHVIEPLRQGKLAFERPVPEGTEFYERVRWALDGADAACSVRAPGYSMVVKSRLFLLLDALYTFRQKDAPQAPDPSAERVRDVLREVKQHYAEPLSVEDAARLAGYSKAHFMRVFKRDMGQTFSQYLTECRLTAAAYHLEKTDEPVGAIARSCGFDNFSYFNRRFRRRFGMTPTEFRHGRGAGEKDDAPGVPPTVMPATPGSGAGNAAGAATRA